MAALAALIAATGLFRASQNMAQTTMSLLGRDQLGLPPAFLGLLIATSGLLGVAASFVVGRVPRGRERPVLLAGLLATAVAIGLYVVPFRPAGFIAGTMLLGLAGGIVMPILATVLANSGEGSADRRLALFTLALSLSLTLGPALESLLLAGNRTQLNRPFEFFALMPLLAAGGLLAANSTGRGALAPVGRRPSTGLGWNRPVRAALAGQLMYALPFAALTSFGAIVFEDLYHLSPAETQAAFTCFFAASLLTRVALAWRGAPRDRVRGLFGAAAITALGLLALLMGRDWPALVLAMVLLGVPHGAVYPLSLMLVSEGVDRADLGRANARFTGMTSLATVLAPLLLGWIQGNFGSEAMVTFTLVPVLGVGVYLARLTGRAEMHSASRSG